jgi:hypothetical protein
VKEFLGQASAKKSRTALAARRAAPSRVQGVAARGVTIRSPCEISSHDRLRASADDAAVAATAHGVAIERELESPAAVHCQDGSADSTEQLRTLTVM